MILLFNREESFLLKRNLSALQLLAVCLFGLLRPQSMPRGRAEGVLTVLRFPVLLFLNRDVRRDLIHARIIQWFKVGHM